MDGWKTDWLSENVHEDIDGYDNALQNESFTFDENTDNSPFLSRYSIESDDEDRNDKSDSTVVKPTFKSISQAKKRLQAFCAMKNLKKHIKDDKSEDVEKFDKNTPKKIKKSLYPDDKAKAVIREIEEIKRNELRQHLIKQELVAASMKRYELRNAKSRSTSREREKHFKKREFKRRNYRRTDSTSRKSASPDSKSNRKTSSKKSTYPKSWKEYEQQHLTIKKDAALKSKLFQPQRMQRFELFSRLYNFHTPAPIMESFKYTACNDDLKDIPFPCLKYTKTTPSLQYNINFKILKESHLTRNQLFSIIPKDRRQLIEKLIHTVAKPAYKANKMKTRLWYSKSWKKPGDAECRVLENSVGLSFLQNYSDQEEEENDVDDVVICSSTQNKSEKNVSVSDARAGTPDKRPESLVEFQETSPDVSLIPSNQQIQQLDVIPVDEEQLDVIVESAGDFTPKKEEMDVRQTSELNETKKAIRELEQELERRQAIMLEAEKNKKKKRKKKRNRIENIDSPQESSKEKKKVKVKKVKHKKKESTSEEDESSEDEKDKKEKKKKKKREKKRSKKKSKSDKGTSKKKIKQKDGISSDDEKTKKKRKTATDTDTMSDAKEPRVLEKRSKKSKSKIKDKSKKHIIDDKNTDIPEVADNYQLKKPDSDWEIIEKVIDYEIAKKVKTDRGCSPKLSVHNKVSTHKDKDLNLSCKQDHSKKRLHEDSSTDELKHSEGKKAKINLEIFDETRDPTITGTRDSDILKNNLEIELNIDKKYLERSGSRIKQQEPVSKFKESIIEQSEKEHSHKVIESNKFEISIESHLKVSAKKEKPIIDLFMDDFPLEKDLYNPKPVEKSPKKQLTGTPDKSEFPGCWEKDNSNVCQTDVRRKLKLDHSWESDEEIFEKKSQSTFPNSEKPRLHNISFDFDIPLNIKPFKKRELVDPQTELSEKITIVDTDKLLVEQLEFKVNQEFEDDFPQENLTPKINLIEDHVIGTPKKGRWDKKDPITKTPIPKPENVDSSNSQTEMIEISSSVPFEQHVNVEVIKDEPSKVLENEYEEFMKSLTSNSLDTNKDSKKTMTNSCSISSFSDISDCSLDSKLEKAKIEKEPKVPGTGIIKKNQLPDSSLTPSLILPIDIPLIPMPCDTKPIPVPSPTINIEKVLKPLINIKFSPKKAPVAKTLPQIGEIINLTLDDDNNAKIENEVTSTVSNTILNKISTDNVLVQGTTCSNDIFDINSICLPPPKLEEIPSPCTNNQQSPTQKQDNNIIDNSLSIGSNVEEKRPFTFTTMVLPTKKLLLDKSKLNLDDSDEEDSKNKSLQKLNDLKKEHLTAVASIQQAEQKVEQVSSDRLPIPIPVMPEPKDKEQVTPKSTCVTSANSSNEKSSSGDAPPKKSTQAKHPPSPKTKRRDSPPRRRGYSPKRYGSPRRRSPSRRKPSPVDRKHPLKSHRSPIHKRRRSITPRRRISPPRRSPLRKRSNSPRKRGASPMKRPFSPRRRSISPRRGVITPRKRSISPRRRSISPRRRCSPLRNRRSISPRKRSISPRRKRSLSPRRRSISPGRRGLKSSVSARSKSPDMTKSLQNNLERHVFDSDKRKSPLTITSPLERLKRSVADSTISDDLLPQPNANYDDYNQSPIYRYYDKSKTMESSPKRIPLDVRISHVLGIKEEPKTISTTYDTYNYHQDKITQLAEIESKKLAIANQYNPKQNFNMPNAKNNFVQVGNMVQIVPTEIPMKTEVSLPKMTMQASHHLPDLIHLQEKSTILQVGNMLQIVPTKMPPRLSLPPNVLPRPPMPSNVLPPPHPMVKQEIEEMPIEQIPEIPIPPVEIPLPEKHSAERTMKLKTAESRAQREQRRQEREKRRADKEKKRREREKVRQIKMKQKTEDMIKRALQLEVEGLEDNEELGLNETPAQWPPLPITPGSKDVGKSILIRGGVCKTSSKLDKRKIVQFADGIKPGEGTSPSGGEELLSPPPSKTLPKEKRYKKSKLFKKKKVKVKVIKKIPKREESDDEDDDLPPPSPPPGSPPPHLFPPRVKIHTVNNLRNYMPNVMAVHSTPTQQLYGQAMNLIMAPTGAMHQPPPPQPRQSMPHQLAVSPVPQMHHMMTPRQAPTLPGSLGLSHLPPYHY